MKSNDIQKLLATEMGFAYDVENQLIDALPKLREIASETELRAVLDSHLEETKKQAKRIEKATRLLDLELVPEVDEPLVSILKSGDLLVQKLIEPNIRDIALIDSGDKVEHYEIAMYESLIELAKKLKEKEVADLLDKSLKEEKMASTKLKMIGADGIQKTIATVM